MGKRQAKKTAGWGRLIFGTTVSVGMYLLGILLLSLLMVKGSVIPEKGNLILTVWVTISAACGSLPVLQIKAVAPPLTGLMQGGVFAALILTASYLFWEGPVWSTSNIILLACALCGGLLPSVFVRRGGRSKRKRGW